MRGYCTVSRITAFALALLLLLLLAGCARLDHESPVLRSLFGLFTSGTLLDKVTEAPIMHARVECRKLNLDSTESESLIGNTDSNGWFYINLMAAGSYQCGAQRDSGNTDLNLTVGFDLTSSGAGLSVKYVPDKPGLYPAIASFTPAKAEAGSTLTVTGVNFSGNSLVSFIGNEVNVIGGSENELTIKLPDDLPAKSSGRIKVSTLFGSALSGYDFTVISPPVISEISPLIGHFDTVVNISGKNFSSDCTKNIVYFNSVKATYLDSCKSDSFRTTVPSGTAPGTYTISVTVDDRTASYSDIFTVMLPLTQVPTIRSFSLSSGNADEVKIHGSYFSLTCTDNTVKFNGKVAYVKLCLKNMLTVTVPSGVETGKVTVSVGGQTATSDADFVVDPLNH